MSPAPWLALIALAVARATGSSLPCALFAGLVIGLAAHAHDPDGPGSASPSEAPASTTEAVTGLPPAALGELLVPDACRPVAPVDEATLQPLRDVLLGGREPGATRLWIGHLPLFLALLALLGAPGPGAWTLRALLALGLGAAMLLPLSQALASSLAWTLLVLLACLASRGLMLLAQPVVADAVDPSVGPGLAAATLAVLAAGGLAALALSLGAGTPREALDPLTGALGAGGHPIPDDAALGRLHAHLVAVLDRAALTAFLAMTAFLLHLKSRSGWTLGLVAAVTVADLLAPTTWPT